MALTPASAQAMTTSGLALTGKIGAAVYPWARPCRRLLRRSPRPPSANTSAFVAFHNGVGNPDHPGYKVSVLFSEPDGRNARIADFLTGFHRKNKGYWALPVGVISDSKGHLYVSSDRITPAIFRIEYDPED